MELQINDIIVMKRNPGVIRKIKEIRDTGYTWVYVSAYNHDIESQKYLSDDSNDPYFNEGWMVKK